MKTSVTALIAAVAATLAISTAATPTAAAAQNWHVTPTSIPSLATVEQTAKPGDTVTLAGTWKNVSLVPQTSGTATAPITYTSTTGATFDGAGPSGVAAITGKSYLAFSHITFQNSNYVLAPVANKGVIVRSSNHVSFTFDSFSHMQMQLIGASYTTVSDNTWRYFVARYVNGQPQTAGDMLNVVLGSHDNTITRNDMQYAGHSLIEVGNGTGNTETNASNLITANTLSNPWYKTVILSDNGAGTTVSGNSLLDANSVPTLTSTIAGQVGTLQTSSTAVQFSGENFTLTGNTIANAVCTYGCVDIGSRYYGTTLIESTYNRITNNTIRNCHGSASFGFTEFQAATDPAKTPDLTGNVISGNTMIGNGPSPYAYFKTYTPFLYHAASVAPPWTKYNGNTVTGNVLDNTAAASLMDVTYYGSTTHVTKSLLAFQALDPTFIHGNS